MSTQPFLPRQQNQPTAYTYTEIYSYVPQGRSTALASFVFSVLGIVFAFIFPVLAVILGYAALARLDPVDPLYEKYRSFAVTGISIGFITIMVNLIVFVVLGATGVLH